jgi:SNF2 family DNA or RNA helicase
MDGGRAGTGGEIILVPRKDRVVSVKPAGEEDVYDIVMGDPARNFVADGIIVHNCGKSRSAADASGGWYRNQLIRPMTPASYDNTWGVEGGVLVVCPKTVTRTWQQELMQWQSASSVVIRGSAVRKKRLAATPSHYHIINPEGLKFVEHNRYDGLILDECHRFSNNTNQTQYALGLAARSRKRLGLSGTPIANSLESIFYPMLILDGGKALGASKTAFLEKFFIKQQFGQFVKHIPNSGAAQAIAAAMAESTHFVTKAEVLPFLPPKTHTPIYLEMSAEQEKYYAQIKKDALVYIQDAEVSVEQASARMMKLLQVCQGFALTDDGGRHFTNAKTDALFEMLTDTLRGRKVIVWCYFKYEIQQIVAGLKARGIKHVHVDGDVTSQRTRDADLHNWNHDPELHVFVRQLGMSEGVTMIANESGNPCYDNIYCGLSYKYIEWKQSQDRIHRIGQEIPCSYTYLLTENGIDRSVYEAVLQKNAVATFVHERGKDFYLELLRAA